MQMVKSPRKFGTLRPMASRREQILNLNLRPAAAARHLELRSHRPREEVATPATASSVRRLLRPWQVRTKVPTQAPPPPPARVPAVGTELTRAPRQPDLWANHWTRFPTIRARPVEAG